MYYEVKYSQLEVDGKKTCHGILVDSEFFAEAEEAANVIGAYEVLSIARRGNIKEVDGDYDLKDGNAFYVCKVAAQTINEKGKPKKMRYRVVTQAPVNSPSAAAKNVEELMLQGYDMTVESCEQKAWQSIVVK